MPRKQPVRRSPTILTAESQAAEAVTVGWLLACLTALVCELGAVCARLLAMERLPMLAGLLMFSALAIGLISVALGVMVLKLRHTPPPRGIIVSAFAVGVLPVVALTLGALW